MKRWPLNKVASRIHNWITNQKHLKNIWLFYIMLFYINTLHLFFKEWWNKNYLAQLYRCFISYVKYQFTISQFKINHSSSGTWDWGRYKENSKISCDLFGVLLAILQIKWIQLLWSLLTKDFVLQSYRVNNLEERQINSQGTRCLEVSREWYKQWTFVSTIKTLLST